MKYMLLIFLLFFAGLSCQTFKRQARKGWKRIDQDWLSASAKEEKAGERAPAQSRQGGPFICERIETHPVISLLGQVENFLNKRCDPDKRWSNPFTEGHPPTICCIKK